MFWEFMRHLLYLLLPADKSRIRFNFAYVLLFWVIPVLLSCLVGGNVMLYVCLVHVGFAASVTMTLVALTVFVCFLAPDSEIFDDRL